MQIGNNIVRISLKHTKLPSDSILIKQNLLVCAHKRLHIRSFCTLPVVHWKFVSFWNLTVIPPVKVIASSIRIILVKVHVLRTLKKTKDVVYLSLLQKVHLTKRYNVYSI